MNAAFRATIHGRVQGVGFRWFVAREARRLGLRGSVRNRDDGSVEVVAAGDVQVLEQLMESLRRGPPGSRVERVMRTDLDPAPDCDDFTILA
jgi:acylphosphatase